MANATTPISLPRRGAEELVPKPPPAPAPSARPLPGWQQEGGSGALLSPHLGPTCVLQLQVLLHEDLVDLVEDNVHAISAHQRQVPVALQQRMAGDGYR